MKYLKKYNESKSYSELCRLYGVKDFTENPDGSIDVEGSVDLYDRELEKLPVKYNRVVGYFDCSYNQLINLEGCPETVGSHFICSYNKLTSLEGSPRSVGGDFDCSSNKLTNLEGSPKSVGRSFWGDNNNLTNLEGAPESVGCFFGCSENKLTSLRGCPKFITGSFSCTYNKIFEFENFPNIGDTFYCDSNPIYQIWKLFKNKSQVELLNDCDPFRLVKGEPAVILDRLNYFLELIGKEKVDKVDKYINI